MVNDQGSPSAGRAGVSLRQPGGWRGGAARGGSADLTDVLLSQSRSEVSVSQAPFHEGNPKARSPFSLARALPPPKLEQACRRKGAPLFLPPEPWLGVCGRAMFLSVSEGLLGDTPERLGGGCCGIERWGSGTCCPFTLLGWPLSPVPQDPQSLLSISPRPLRPRTLPAPPSPHARSRGARRLPPSIMRPLTPLFLGDEWLPDRARDTLTCLWSPRAAWPGSPHRGRFPRGPDWAAPGPVSCAATAQGPPWEEGASPSRSPYLPGIRRLPSHQHCKGHSPVCPPSHKVLDVVHAHQSVDVGPNLTVQTQR